MALFSTIGNIISSNSQRKAANRAAETVENTNEENIALFRDMFDTQQGYLAPYATGGMQAFNTRNALLGLGGGQQAVPQAANNNTPNSLAVPYSNGYSSGEYAAPQNGAWWTNDYGTNALASYNPTGTNAGLPASGIPAQHGQVGHGGVDASPWQTSSNVPGVDAQQAANDAFDIFRNSTGYQFRYNQGMDALNSGWAGAGTLQSGAAMQAAQEYGQNFASNEFNNYMNMLGSQQAAGLGGASALAGVGSNYTGQVAAANNSTASALANAQLARGANNPWAAGLNSYGNSLQSIAGFALGGGF